MLINWNNVYANLNLVCCFGLKLIWLITVSNFFPNLSNTKNANCVYHSANRMNKAKKEQSIVTYCERWRLCVLPVASDLQHRSRSLSTVPCRGGGCWSSGTRPRNKQCYKSQRKSSHSITFEVRLNQTSENWHFWFLQFSEFFNR